MEKINKKMYNFILSSNKSNIKYPIELLQIIHSYLKIKRPITKFTNKSLNNRIYHCGLLLGQMEQNYYKDLRLKKFRTIIKKIIVLNRHNRPKIN